MRCRHVGNAAPRNCQGGLISPPSRRIIEPPFGGPLVSVRRPPFGRALRTARRAIPACRAGRACAARKHRNPFQLPSVSAFACRPPRRGEPRRYKMAWVARSAIFARARASKPACHRAGPCAAPCAPHMLRTESPRSRKCPATARAWTSPEFRAGF